MRLILASTSPIRRLLLERAVVAFETLAARIDEEALRQALLAEGAAPRDIAAALAEAKARKIGEKHPGAMVIGCDQVLDFGGEVLSKPESADAALAMLQGLGGKTHFLHSAAVIYHEGASVWRHVSTVRMRMRALSERYLAEYTARNWPSIAESVGAYKIEEEGIRLFDKIEGDYFAVLGVPLLEVLGYLVTRGAIEA
jgi:septum formation protein